MSQLNIEKLKTSELDLLQTIGKQTFFETFAETNSQQDMEKYLNDNFSQQQLSKEIIDPNSAFYFATIDDKVVGYLKVNWAEAQTEHQGDDAFEIERIYVLKKYHGHKVGQKLCDKAFELAKKKSFKFIWLGVWEHNPRAINFYHKNGFKPFGTHTFVVGTDAQTDVLMRLTI